MGIKRFWSRPTPSEVQVVGDSGISSGELEIVHDGNLKYTVATAGNGSKPSYQEAVGAPVESKSPLGYHVGWLTVIFLNVNQMIGTGIFSTPGTILNRTGSIGLALIYWAIGILLAVAGFCVYLELASYFPNRSGSEVVYLEQAYPRPKHFFPIAFAVYSVILSFSSSNAIVMSTYLWQLGGRTPTDWQLKGVAVAVYTVAVICESEKPLADQPLIDAAGVLIHNKYSLWAVNVIGGIKILTLAFISTTGFVVLGGNVSGISDPGANFCNSFEGTTSNGNDLSVALVNIIFAYTGYQNAFSLVNEINNPVPTLKRNGAISVGIVGVLYILCNIAYFAAVPKAEFAKSGQTAASVFFAAVFGKGGAQKGLDFLVLLSAFGNLLATLIGASRSIREVGRQGVLPFTEFWVSTKPFGTPLGPYFLKWVVTFIVIVAPPAGDAFQFIVSLPTYPDGLFSLALAVGLFLIRYRHKHLNRGRPDFKAWDIMVLFYVLIQLYTIATPWIPPKGGPYAGEVSFWYATYCVVGIGIILACGVYYIAWMYLLPRWGGYELRPETLNVDTDGANTHRLVKVPLDGLVRWDEEHDEAGHLRRNGPRSLRSSQGDVSQENGT
ncbi:Uu.00g139460.m01.CDS01 [Anthostomella pinea]|uniref:Uu.00g139460.m01.CDS01 n=1 Tax=Anthostomella pinea TaxID=933095 RepID=A0AAI8VJG7_9PEZI|nr:Uu.00g139460.m01.CDS01 [Anthostomella pinea]